MTIKSRLTTIAIISAGTVLLLLGILLYTNWQIDNHLDKIDRVNNFSNTASELNIITEQYLAYQEARYLETWQSLFGELQNTQRELTNFPNSKVVVNALPSINQAFTLIQEIQNSPEKYEDPQMKRQILERASARIRSDIQLLLSLSQRLEQNRRESIRELQQNQRLLVLFILIPGIGIVLYLIFRVRKQILISLRRLLEGTRSIGQGNLEKKIPIKGFEEHETLAASFNNMASKLHKQIKKQQYLRQHAEESRKRWETLVEQDPSLILIHINGEIVFINSAGVEIAGAQDANQLIGTSVYDFITEDHEKAEKRIQKVQEEEKKLSPTLYKLQRFDGEQRFLQMQSVPIDYEGQTATQTVGVDITDRVTYETELQESLEEKSVLLREIHHRVKNNLAIISGMMQLQVMESTNEKLRKTLTDSQLRIQSMAHIHELLYESDNFAKLRFSDHIKKLANTVADTINTDTKVDITYNLDEEISININQAIPCGLIINELVTNALKHAFENTDGGVITIAMQQEGRELTLTVSDNGKGLPDGLDLRNANTLGMRIIQSLLQQLDASLQYGGKNGSTFAISFEIAEVKGIGNTHLNN